MILGGLLSGVEVDWIHFKFEGLILFGGLGFGTTLESCFVLAGFETFTDLVNFVEAFSEIGVEFVLFSCAFTFGLLMEDLLGGFGVSSNSCDEPSPSNKESNSLLFSSSVSNRGLSVGDNEDFLFLFNFAAIFCCSLYSRVMAANGLFGDSGVGSAFVRPRLFLWTFWFCTLLSPSLDSLSASSSSSSSSLDSVTTNGTWFAALAVASVLIAVLLRTDLRAFVLGG